jgi:hypothetical protein
VARLFTTSGVSGSRKISSKLNRLRKEYFAAKKLPSGAEAPTYFQRNTGTSELVPFPISLTRFFSAAYRAASGMTSKIPFRWPAIEFGILSWKQAMLMNTQKLVVVLGNRFLIHLHMSH